MLDVSWMSSDCTDGTSAHLKSRSVGIIADIVFISNEQCSALVLFLIDPISHTFSNLICLQAFFFFLTHIHIHCHSWGQLSVHYLLLGYVWRSSGSIHQLQICIQFARPPHNRCLCWFIPSQDAHELFHVLTSSLEEERDRQPKVTNLFDMHSLEVIHFSHHFSCMLHPFQYTLQSLLEQ